MEQIAKDKLDQATDKLGDVEQLAKDKLGQVTDKLGDVQSQVEDKLGDVQSQAEDKLGDLQSQAEDKLGDVQSQVEDKLPQDQLDNINKFIAEKEDKASSFKTQAEKDYENGKQNLKNKINQKNTNEGKPTLDDDDLNQDASLKDIIKSKQDLQDTGKLSKNETLNRINNLDDDFKSDALIDLGDHSDEVVKQNLSPKEQEESMRAKSQELMEEGEKKQAERNNPKPSAEEDDDDDDEMPPLEDQEGNILPSEPSMEEQMQTLRDNLKPSTEPTEYTEEETSGKSFSKAPVQDEDLFDDFGNVKGDYDITDFHTQQYNISKQSSQIKNARQPNQAESDLGDFKTKPIKRSELLEDQNKENFKDQIEDLDNKPASAEKFSKRTDQIKKQLGGDDDFEESGDGEVPSLLKPPPATITEKDLFTDSDNEEEEEKEPEPEPESKQGPIFVDESDDDEPAVDEKEPEPETDEEEDEKEPEPETEPEPKINPNLEANIDADPELDNNFNPIKSEEPEVEDEVEDEPLKASDGWADEYDSKTSALQDRYDNLGDEGQNLFDKEWGESKISTKGIPNGSMEEETAQRNNISNSSEIMDRAEALTPQQETQAPAKTTEDDAPKQSSTDLANQNSSQISSENQETEEDDKGSGGGDDDEDEDDDVGGGADDDVLADLTADSTVLDENPLGDVITGILGIGSLVASAFGGDDAPSWRPTLQSAYQAGTSSTTEGF